MERILQDHQTFVIWVVWWQKMAEPIQMFLN